MEIKKKAQLRIGDILEVPIKQWNNEHAGENGAVKTQVIVVGVYPNFVNFKTQKDDLIRSIQNVDLVRLGIYDRNDVYHNYYGTPECLRKRVMLK